MSARAQFTALPDGRRHFHDGPIDLILEASGPWATLAYEAAAARFATILDELCLELPRLRVQSGPCPQGVVARRMVDAVAPFASARFITPMAAVAGAVAEEVLAAMTQAAPLERAYVNNGGDIALHLARRSAVTSPRSSRGEGKGEEQSRLDAGFRKGRGPCGSPTPTLSHKAAGGAPAPSFAIGLVARPDRPTLFGKARITADDAARGLATSGWRGRSFSLGVADAVTVIARSAALADAAATLIANAVDLPGHPAILRAPARSRDPQSDLGDRLITLAVGGLSDDEIGQALDNGAREAELWIGCGHIEAVALSLAGRTREVGADAALYSPTLPHAMEPRYALG